MKKQMKKSALVALLLTIVGSFSNSAYAGVASGLPMNVFADPSDFVVELNTPGECGSKYFHIQRNNANFKEITAVVLTAFSMGKPLTLFVASCVNDRNIISHGYASR